VILEVPCIALHDPSVLTAKAVALSVLMNCSTILPHLAWWGCIAGKSTQVSLTLSFHLSSIADSLKEARPSQILGMDLALLLPCSDFLSLQSYFSFIPSRIRLPRMVSLSATLLIAFSALVSAQPGRLYSSCFAIPGNASYDYVGICSCS
jgi:hypothetical protein